MKNKYVMSTGLGLEPTKFTWIQKDFFDKTGANINIHHGTDALSLLRNALGIQ
jgi:hypothetical protein